MRCVVPATVGICACLTFALGGSQSNVSGMSANNMHN